MKKIRIPLVILFSVFQIFSFATTDYITSVTQLGDIEIGQGLKEALRVSTASSTEKAHKLDGYFLNPKIKIPFPPEVKNVEKILRKNGFNNLVDGVVLKLNRAAEDAADDAKGIFIDAITKMTIVDAVSILKGGNYAATNYLKSKTSNNLKLMFKPKIQASLTSVGAIQAWKTLTSTYNRIPLVQPVNTDLAEYTTNKALDGLFVLVAEEESKIRTDPAARVTAILQKVFKK